jgi:chemotaxis protein MotB
MIRATFTITSVALILAGCSTYSPDSKAAKEFATQKEGLCCYVGMKTLPDEAAAKAAQYPDLSGQLADANRNLANKERENADLTRQLAASKAGQNPDRAGEVAALTAANADLTQQLAAFKTRPAPFAQLLEREYFDSGSAKLKPEGVKKLKQLSADLKAKAGADKDIRIEGHTDDRPIHTAQFPSNWELSSARANAVVRELHNDGINGEQLLAVGYGASRPAAPNTSAESRAKNRRVEIILAPALATPAQPK